jgi:hypothetical protein
VYVVFNPGVGEPLHRGRGPHNLIVHFWLFFEKTSKNETEIDVRHRFEAPDEKDQCPESVPRVGTVPQFCTVP